VGDDEGDQAVEQPQTGTAAAAQPSSDAFNAGCKNDESSSSSPPAETTSPEDAPSSSSPAAGDAPSSSATAALEPVQEFIWSLLDAFVDPLLAWVHAHGKEVVGGVDVARLGGVTTLLGQLLETEG